MQLIAELKDTQVQDAVIPVTWCLYKKEHECLRLGDVKNPHLLIVTAHRGCEVGRQLVPLDQVLTYIQFQKPGENKIFARVVWHYEGNAKELRKIFLEIDSHGNYETHVLNSEGDGLLKEIYHHQFKPESDAELLVTVPVEFFAPEPSKFEQWWVNLWFETRQKDQCQFRKRRFIAYPLQPIPVFLFVVFITFIRTISAGICLFLGMRGINLKAVIHPFRYRTMDVDSAIIWNLGDSVFIKDAKGRKRPWQIRLLRPSVVVSTIVTITAINLLIQWLFPSSYIGSHLTLPWWYYPLGLLGMFVATVVFYFVFALIAALLVAAYKPISLVLKQLTKLLSLIPRPKRLIPAPISDFMTRYINNLSEAWTGWRADRKKVRDTQRAKRARLRRELDAERQREIERAKQQRFAELQQLIGCDSPLEPRLEALPRKQQTIHLKLLAFKAYVCKPYAQ